MSALLSAADDDALMHAIEACAARASFTPHTLENAAQAVCEHCTKRLLRALFAYVAAYATRGAVPAVPALVEAARRVAKAQRDTHVIVAAVVATWPEAIAELVLVRAAPRDVVVLPSGKRAAAA